MIVLSPHLMGDQHTHFNQKTSVLNVYRRLDRLVGEGYLSKLYLASFLLLLPARGLTKVPTMLPPRPPFPCQFTSRHHRGRARVAFLSSLLLSSKSPSPLILSVYCRYVLIQVPISWEKRKNRHYSVDTLSLKKIENWSVSFDKGNQRKNVLKKK